MAEPATHTARLEVTDFGWRHAGRKTPVFSNLNFTVDPGETVLLLGTSGAGKSTLLAGIAGVLGDAEDGEAAGSITIDGVPTNRTTGQVGMVLQDPDSQVISSRVGDDVVFGCENLGISRAEMWQRAEHALHVVGLNLPFDHPTTQLSGGQKQRLALAGVIAMQPKVIVLDEPTANLDPDGVNDVRDAVIAAVKDTGATLIVVEHQLSTWADHMDRVLVLHQSQIIADGPASDTLDRHADMLTEAGLWVPGVPLDIPALTATPNTEGDVMVTEELGVGWNGPVQDHLNLTLHPGSTVVTGRNGAGKTTLALTLGGLVEPISGRIKMPAYSGQPHTWRSQQLVTRIGYVFQDPEHQFMMRTVREELLLGPRMAGMDADAADTRVDELLNSLRLTHLSKANPFTLSGGEKRRLSVATMLATNPDLLIVDEPTFGQDRATFTAMVRLLSEHVATGTSLLSISHDANFRSIMAQHEWELS